MRKASRCHPRTANGAFTGRSNETFATFHYTGVDFAGPFFFKASPGRGRKVVRRYVAVFVCMVVKAVHLEVVSDLTTAAFLAAFRRFVARRGLCKVVYSDNGINFQGAETELRRLEP